MESLKVHTCYKCPLCKSIHEGIEVKTICSETNKNVDECFDKIDKSCPYKKK